MLLSEAVCLFGVKTVICSEISSMQFHKLVLFCGIALTNVFNLLPPFMQKINNRVFSAQKTVKFWLRYRSTPLHCRNLMDCLFSDAENLTTVIISSHFCRSMGWMHSKWLASCIADIVWVNKVQRNAAKLHEKIEKMNIYVL